MSGATMTLRDDLRAIRAAALAAVDAGAAVRRHLRRTGDCIHAGDVTWRMSAIDRIVLVSIGKAAAPMAAAAADILGGSLDVGVVLTKHGHAEGFAFPDTVRCFEAGHPVPDAAGMRGAQASVELLATTTARDRVLLLISGGGSALLTLPVASLTLADLQATTAHLLRAGATIEHLNSVRKHLSRVKGGQLALMAAPAPLVALVLSDVIGDPLDVIASGPAAPDPTTYADAWEVLAQFDLLRQVPAAVREVLAAGKAGELPETPKPGAPLFQSVTHVIIGSNRMAARAAIAAAEARGYRALLLTTFVEGEAREVAKVAVALARGIRAHGDPLAAPACLVWGGETTVTVRGAGKGGRNQELALAAALSLTGLPDVALMALATDGTDGPTDAAGAIVDGQTVVAARDAGHDPRAALAANDAYPLLDTVGALMRTGPTGTNVNDLMVLLVA